MAALIYSLCGLTCLAAFGLLLRSWRATRVRLLFWSALCFAGLTLNNILLVVDKLVLPQVDLSVARLLAALLGVLLLLFGLIWEEQ
jgi:hydrogenase/urease accessory protein HupE